MRIQGYASFFNVIDSSNDLILPGAFTKTLKFMKQYDHILPLLDEHDGTRVIGKIDKFKQNKTGLWVEATLFKKEKFDEIKMLFNNHINVGFSIGYRAMVGGYYNERHKTYDTITGGNVKRILKELHLLEISVVKWPANSHCVVSIL